MTLAELDTGLDALTTAELRQRLAAGLKLTAQALSSLALVWAELERRGEDLRDLKKGIARWLPLIAAGRLLPQAVVDYAGRPYLLLSISQLPLAKQEALVAGEKVELYQPESGEIAEAPLNAIPNRALPSVFGESGIRSGIEQKVILSAGPKFGHRWAEAKVLKRVNRVRFDPETGLVSIANTQAPLRELLVAIAATAGPDKGPPPKESVRGVDVASARVWPEEKQALRDAAVQMDLPESEVVRKAIRAFLAGVVRAD